MAASAEMMCALAALILKDSGKDITGDSISSVLKAAGAEVEAFWPKLFAQALEGVDIGALMTAVGSGPAVGAAAAPAAGSAAPAAAEEKKEEKKEEPEEEEDDDMGFSLFD